MNVVITGTSSGIGYAIAKKFLDAGHAVTGIDVLKSSLIHKNYRHVVSDITEGDLPDLGGVEILVNCAGVQNSGRDIEVNLKGSMRVTERYAMQSEIKSVLFLASASASSGSEFPEYAASKGGILAYMKNVALRIAKFGATANSLSPGGVLTKSNAHVLDSPALKEAALSEALLNKWATAEEIAEWAYFMTVVNKSMTAQDVLVDNGEIAKSNFIW